ncbi:ParB N-terminal domain-containing protein [Acaryochloris marina NIES-2412]|uniref:hypothetical protein n=1 Tax=Acaryochloris marina TaxID=155978 RepID=UPI004059A08A
MTNPQRRSTTQPESLPIESITLDQEIQPRQQLNQEVVAEYAEAMRQGAAFPPVVAYYDGSKFWLADGFHRIAAKQANGDLEILAEVESGSQREAKLFAVGANTDHGLRRTSADKRRAVKSLLNDRKWSQWSNREIARRCGVSYEMVRLIRSEVSDNFCQRQKRIIRRNGKVQGMNISNIGTRSTDKKHTPRYSKTTQKIDLCNHIPHQTSEQQPVAIVESTDQQVPNYKPFRIIDAESVPSDPSDPQLEVYSRILMEGPIKAWSIILTQMQTHPAFAEMVWREAQDLWVNSN